MVRYGRLLLLWPLLSWLASAAMAQERPLPAHRAVFEALEPLFQPSQPKRTADDSGGGAESPVRQVLYMAQEPDPNGPLGFEGARFSPTAPIDPGMNQGFVVDEPFEEFYDPMDPEAPAPTVSSGEWIHNGRWYTQQSVVYMIRSVSVKNEIRLATDLSSAILPSELAHLDIAPNMGFQPGLRSTIGRYLGRDPRNRDHAVEFTFLGLTHWQDAASLTAKFPGNIISNIDPLRGQGGLPAFNGSNFQNYAQTSSFNSYELNYRINRRLSRDQMVYTRDSTWVRQCTRSPLPSIFAGLRVVTVAEKLKYLAESSTANGRYDIATHNNMVGLQAGADWFYEHYEWRLGGQIKAASLVNWSNQSSRVRILDDNGTPLLPNRDEFAESRNLGFVGEISVIGAYQFNPNFAFRASYDMMWITALALAQNQITFSPSTPPQVSDAHSLFYQGFSIGLELTR